MSQPAPLREQLKALENLQEIDLKIDRLKKDKNSLPAALKTLDDTVARAKLAHDAKKNAQAEAEKTLGQTRAALELNKDRLARSSTRLEGVQNSQEFQAANKELEQLRKLALTLEEQAKKSTLEIEAHQKEATVLAETLAKVQADRDAQAQTLSGQGTTFDAQIGSLNGERGQFTPRVDPRLLAQYDRVRGARAGLGIVPAVGGRCKGCNMMVPPQLYNEIQRGSALHACPSCHRILFVPASAETSQPTA